MAAPAWQPGAVPARVRLIEGDQAPLLSRVPQAIPIARPVALWVHAIEGFLQRPIPGRLFEVLGDGRVVAWDIQP